MLFTAAFFKRLLNNVKPGTAYYPIIFSQYDPDHVGMPKTHFTIDEMAGFWREYGYGMVALYKSDFDKAGGFDVKIEGKKFCPRIDKKIRPKPKNFFRMGSRGRVSGNECYQSQH